MLFGSCVSTCPNLVTIQERKHLTMFSKIASVLAWRPCMSAQLSTPKELGEWGASFRWQPQALTPSILYKNLYRKQFYTKRLLHEAAFTLNTFWPFGPKYQTNFAPNKIYLKSPYIGSFSKNCFDQKSRQLFRQIWKF